MARGVQIGEVLKQTGLSVDTIRYHEKERLLREPTRSEGGYRLYGVRDVEHLLFVRKAQELGFTLAEIRELLLVQDERRGLHPRVGNHTESAWKRASENRRFAKARRPSSRGTSKV